MDWAALLQRVYLYDVLACSPSSPSSRSPSRERSAGDPRPGRWGLKRPTRIERRGAASPLLGTRGGVLVVDRASESAEERAIDEDRLEGLRIDEEDELRVSVGGHPVAPERNRDDAEGAGRSHSGLIAEHHDVRRIDGR